MGSVIPSFANNRRSSAVRTRRGYPFFPSGTASLWSSSSSLRSLPESSGWDNKVRFVYDRTKVFMEKVLRCKYDWQSIITSPKYSKELC